MSDLVAAAPKLSVRPNGLARLIPDTSTRRALVAIAAALLFWQVGATSRAWLGVPLPVIGAVPAPDAVLAAWAKLLGDPGYWQSWVSSLLRVTLGFAAATAIGACSERQKRTAGLRASKAAGALLGGRRKSDFRRLELLWQANRQAPRALQQLAG